jgi:glycosyltransferase involved in cell wall biosynthesis
MKILIIAMSESIHTARWINQIVDEGWDIHLFPAVDHGFVNPHLKNVAVHHLIYTGARINKSHTIKNRGFRIPFNPFGVSSSLIFFFREFMNRHMSGYSAWRLRRLIKRLGPDIIHSLEFQHSGYLLFRTLYQDDYTLFGIRNNSRYYIKKIIDMLYRHTPLRIRNVIKYLLKRHFNNSPDKVQNESASGRKESMAIKVQRLVGQNVKWIATSWGSDIFYFGRFREHRSKIEALLKNCDLVTCDCNRDVKLIQSMGIETKAKCRVVHSTGGYNLEEVFKLRRHGLASERRVIMLKGYSGWVYRSLVALRALERCKDCLKGYTLLIYLAHQDVQEAAELFRQDTGIHVRIVPYSSHARMLRLFGHARISIGLSISDGVPNTLLEAMVMGAFPIQSYTSAANEWIEDGVTGLLVPPEDPDVIEKAIRRALIDDDLVNRAAEENWKTAVERLDEATLKKKAIDFYEGVIRS